MHVLRRNKRSWLTIAAFGAIAALFVLVACGRSSSRPTSSSPTIISRPTARAVSIHTPTAAAARPSARPPATTPQPTP